MRHYGYEDFYWHNNELFSSAHEYICKVELDRVEHFYKIHWSNGLSEDFYNLTRAKDNAVKIAVKEYNAKSSQEELTGASLVSLNTEGVPV